MTDKQEQLTEMLQAQLTKQKEAFAARTTPPSYKDRNDALNRLHDAIYEHRFDLCRALDEDFGGRSVEETLLLEIFTLLDEIRHTKRHLKKWMKPHRVMPNWQFLPSRTTFIYQPLGVVGVMGAWNYQLLLNLSPMIGAIAAGNHVMVRPSELAPKAAEQMQKIIEQCFSDDYVTVITGDTDVSVAFGKLAFDHMIFTGSTNVGKIIMRNAAESLTPVTLELGGKSPALIGEDYDIDSAARKIMHGKLQNAGQTCVAPDYVMVHESQKQAFIRAAADAAAEFYPTLVDNHDYTHILSKRHYERLDNIVAEVTDKGGKALIVNPANEDCNSTNKVFAPTLVHDCPEESVAINEEVFGPILPVVTYQTLSEALQYINNRPRPLALYYFSRDKSKTKQVLYGTISGGVTVNGCIYHLPQNNLPFGGVGDSGMGAYHGLDGFETFSKKKAAFFQSRFSLTKFMRPPYGKTMHRLINFVLQLSPRPIDIPEKARSKKIDQ